MKFPMKRSMPPRGNAHDSRKSPRPNKNEVWELAMSDEIDEQPMVGADCICEDAFTTCNKCNRDVSNDPVFTGVLK